MSRRLWVYGTSGTWVRPARRDVGRGYVPDGFRPRSFPAAWDVGGVAPTYSGSTIDTHSPPPSRLSRAMRPPWASAISRASPRPRPVHGPVVGQKRRRGLGSTRPHSPPSATKETDAHGPG